MTECYLKMGYVQYKFYLNKEILFLYFILFSFFMPAFFLYKEPFSDFYFIFSYGRCFWAIVFTLTLLSKNGWRVGWAFIWWAIFCGCWLISSIMGEMAFASWANNSLMILGIFTGCFYFYSRNSIRFLIATFYYFFGLILINDGLMLVYPNGLFSVTNDLGIQTYYLLAAKNSFSTFIFPALMFAHLCFAKNLIKSKLLFLTIILCMLPPIICKSVTSIIGILLCEMIIYFYHKIWILRSKKAWVIILFVVCIMQLIFTYVFELNIIQYIVVNILHKDPTLSGRAMIWESAHEMIRNNFLLGRGNGRNGYYFYCVVGDYVKGSIMWAHNTSLDLLVQGGIALYLSFYGIVISALKRQLKLIKTEKSAIIILALFITYTIMGYTERFNLRADFYIVLAMAFSIGLFDRKISII